MNSNDNDLKKYAGYGNVVDFPKYTIPVSTIADFMPSKAVLEAVKQAVEPFSSNEIYKTISGLNDSPIFSGLKAFQDNLPTFNNYTTELIPALNAAKTLNFLPESKHFFKNDYLGSLDAITNINKNLYSDTLIDTVKSFNADTLLGGKSAAYWNNELTSSSAALKETIDNFSIPEIAYASKPTFPAVKLVEDESSDVKLLAIQEEANDLLAQQLEIHQQGTVSLAIGAEFSKKTAETVQALTIFIQQDAKERGVREVKQDAVAKRRHTHTIWFGALGLLASIAVTPAITYFVESLRKPTPVIATIDVKQMEALTKPMDLRLEKLERENMDLRRELASLKSAPAKKQKKKRPSALTTEARDPLTTEQGVSLLAE